MPNINNHKTDLYPISREPHARGKNQNTVSKNRAVLSKSSKPKIMILNPTADFKNPFKDIADVEYIK